MVKKKDWWELDNDKANKLDTNNNIIIINELNNDNDYNESIDSNNVLDRDHNECQQRK